MVIYGTCFSPISGLKQEEGAGKRKRGRKEGVEGGTSPGQGQQVSGVLEPALMFKILR